MQPTGQAVAMAAGPHTTPNPRPRAVRLRTRALIALCRSRLATSRACRAGRALAAMAAIASAIGVPLALLALFTAALAGHPGPALHRVGLGLGGVIFAVITGVTLGGAGAVCGRVGQARGRWLLLAVIAGPWALADLAGHGAWSIPGALGAVLDFTLSGRGLSL